MTKQRFSEVPPLQATPDILASCALQVKLYSKTPESLETGLRTSSAGIPYTFHLRNEAIGFPTFGLPQKTLNPKPPETTPLNCPKP